MLASDTPPAAERLQVALWQRMSSVEKARLCSELTRAVWQLSLSGMRRRHPSATERECFLRMARLVLGAELARRAYPDTAALSDP